MRQVSFAKSLFFISSLLMTLDGDLSGCSKKQPKLSWKKY